MKRKLIALVLTIILLTTCGCSSKDFGTVDAGKEKAIDSIILNQPGGDEIPEAYLDLAYELSRIAAADWTANGKPSGYSFEWTYLGSSQSLLKATSIALEVTYADGHSCVYSSIIYR